MTLPSLKGQKENFMLHVRLPSGSSDICIEIGAKAPSQDANIEIRGGLHSWLDKTWTSKIHSWAGRQFSNYKDLQQEHKTQEFWQFLHGKFGDETSSAPINRNCSNHRACPRLQPAWSPPICCSMHHKSQTSQTTLSWCQ